MGTKLTLRYDRESGILHIDTRLPYAEQESEELVDEVIARLPSDSGCSSRLARRPGSS